MPMIQGDEAAVLPSTEAPLRHWMEAISHGMAVRDARSACCPARPACGNGASTGCGAATWRGDAGCQNRGRRGPLLGSNRRRHDVPARRESDEVGDPVASTAFESEPGVRLPATLCGERHLRTQALFTTSHRAGRRWCRAPRSCGSIRFGKGAWPDRNQRAMPCPMPCPMHGVQRMRR